MKYIYLSQPAVKDKEQEVRKVKNMFTDLVKSKELILDQNHMYQFIELWPHDDKFIRPFDMYMKTISKRLRAMPLADHFVFIENWMDFPECKLDRYIISLFKFTNILEFKVEDDKLHLVGSLERMMYNV